MISMDVDVGVLMLAVLAKLVLALVNAAGTGLLRNGELSSAKSSITLYLSAESIGLDADGFTADIVGFKLPALSGDKNAAV